MPETSEEPLKGERGTRAPQTTPLPAPRKHLSLEDSVSLSDWPLPEDRDREFWEEMLDHFHNKLVSMIHTANLRHRQDDILQDIGAKIYERLDRLPPLVSPYTILMVITRSVIRDHLRRERRRAVSLDLLEESQEFESPDSEVEADLERLTDITRLWLLLRSLPAVERICVEMKYLGLMPVEEIARVRQMKPEAVKRAISRAFAKVHRYYMESEAGGEPVRRKRGVAVWNPCFIAERPHGVAVLHGAKGRVLLSNPSGINPALFLRQCTTCKRICTSHPK